MIAIITTEQKDILIGKTYDLSFAFLGNGLNSTEVTAFNTLVNNMQTTLGRAV